MGDVREETARAWDRFTELLSEARDVVTGPLGGRDERELAEGLRHLTRLTSVAIEMIVEKGDPARPEFTRWMSPWRKLMGDNPGTIYDAAILDPALTYRIRGHKGGADYLGICAYGTGDGGARSVAGNLDTEISYDSDGAFEVVLAAVRPDDLGDASFLELSADTTDILVRQYFRSEGRAEATYVITAEPQPGAPAPLVLDDMAARLERAGRWIRDLVEVEATVSALSESGAAPEMRAPSSSGAHEMGEIDWNVVNRVQPTPAMHYSGGWFADLGDDEAILVEGVLPDADYVSAQWLTRWMESGDYLHHTVALTGGEIEVGPDGRFTVVIAHADPGVRNWLETTGHRHGNAVFRALHAQGDVDVTFRRVRWPSDG
jgi:hypothetical protein